MPEKNEPLENIMGAEEASRIWGLSASHIKDLAAQRKIKAKKIGKTWVIDRNQTNPKKK